MFPPRWVQPPCMNIDVNSVIQIGEGPRVSSMIAEVPSGSAIWNWPTMSRPVVISAGTALYPAVKSGFTSW